MRCTAVERELSRRQDGTIDSRLEPALKSHLSGCAACRRFASSLALLSAELAPCGKEPVAPTGAASRAVQEWQAAASASPYAWRTWRSALLAASTCAIAAASLLTFRHWNAARPESFTRPSLADGTAAQAKPPIEHDSENRASPSPEQHSLAAGPRIFPSLARTPAEPGAPRMPQIPIDDIDFVNRDAGAAPGRWARLEPDENSQLQADLMRSVKSGDDFVSVPLPQLAGVSSSSLAAAKRAWQSEKAIVDPRLVRKMTLGVKSLSFADLCKQWTSETGIEFSAARTVADDKVTLFCKAKPLRDIMRQITQVFGFLWRRIGDEGQYRYELYQDLRGQLVEEELRNRDRNEALMALDKEMEKYRKFMDLTPEQARAMAETADPADKHALEQLGGAGWGAAHLYFGLSGDQMAALRGGGQVEFSTSPDSGQAEIPGSMRGSVLRSIPNAHVYQQSDGQRGLVMGGDPPPGTTSVSPADIPDARATASLRLNSNELGQFELEGGSGFSLSDGNGSNRNNMAAMMADTLATGVSPSVRTPENAKANKDLARDPTLAGPVQSSLDPRYQLEERRNRPGGPRVTSADVLEALHKKTGLDIVADSFLRLYDPTETAITGKSLFDALNRSCDVMRIRWTKADGWLRLRSASYFNDRLKEVPNRLLARWQESRKANGLLTTEDLMQIATLSDAQLDAGAVAEAIQAIYGLKEWSLAASRNVRTNWRFVASLAPALRNAAFSEKGITFSQLPVGLQQQYVTLALGPSADRIPLQLADLASASLKVEYPHPVPQQSEGQQPHAPRSTEAEADVRFTYEFGSPTAGRFKRTLGANSSSFGQDAPGKRLQSADSILRGARP
jgi:hypothetical protein